MTRAEEKHNAFVKAARYCAYQERSLKEVREKLNSLLQDPSEVETLLVELQEEGYINLARFTEAFVRGKFFNNKWGKRKIMYGLQHHEIPDILISEKIEEVISDSDYYDVTTDLMSSKMNSLPSISPLAVKQKIFQYLTGKGFEIDIIQKIWKEIGLKA
jgi:regulatory protein